MPLVIDPARYSSDTLAALVQRLRSDLVEVRELIEAPRGRVLDAASLATARELVDSALALVDRPGPRDRDSAAAEANLAHSVLVAAIDLVKSHTDVPRVPSRRSPGG